MSRAVKLLLGAAVLSTWAPTAMAHVPVIYITDSSEDWCQVIDDAMGGDIVMLEAGEYEGPCTIVAKPSDPVGEQTVVQSLDPIDPAILRPAPGQDTIFEVSGAALILLQLELRDVPAGGVAVRVGTIEELWLRWSVVADVAGHGLLQVGDATELFVTDTEFRDVDMPVQIGCPDGSCVAAEFGVESSLIVGADRAIDVGPGSAGAIRDTVVTATSGLSLNLRGGGDVLVDGNVFEGSGGGVVVSDGPATVRNNVVMGTGTGVALAAGGSLSDVGVLGNTILGGPGAATELGGWGDGRDLRFMGNVVDETLVAPGGGQVEGNVACPDPAVCFTDPTAWDFYPAPDSPVRGAGVQDIDLLADWCFRARQSPPCAGAFSAPGPLSFGPLDAVFKAAIDCTVPDAPHTETGATDTATTDTGSPTTAPTTTGDDGQATASNDRGTHTGCGCNSGSVVGWLPILAVFAFRIRARR